MLAVPGLQLRLMVQISHKDDLVNRDEFGVAVFVISEGGHAYAEEFGGLFAAVKPVVVFCGSFSSLKVHISARF